MADAAVLTRQLRKEYPNGTLALGGLDLEIGTGEFFGLLGPNGAGKSTTIGILTTLLRPTSGEAFVLGHHVQRDATAVRRSIGVASQGNTLDRSLSARNVIYYHARYYGTGRKRAAEIADENLARFGLENIASQPVGYLSGGLARRLMLARAMAHEPSVLILDEPTTGLDVQSRLALWDSLSALQSTGVTLILTTHYIEEAERLCGRVGIVNQGQLLAIDSPKRLIASLGDEPVITLTVRNDPPKTFLRAVAKLSDDAAVSTPSPREVTLRVRQPQEMLADVLACATKSRVTIEDISIQRSSLEAVVVALTKEPS